MTLLHLPAALVAEVDASVHPLVRALPLLGRKRAWRRRRAGLAENAHNGARGARRGRVSLGEATASDLAWAAVREGLMERTLGHRHP